MANANPEQSDADDLSVIPYHREVLRSANSVVVYDPTSKRIIRRNIDNGVAARNSREDGCPTCHRPWHADGAGTGPAHAAADLDEQPSFINHDYFRMLASSQPGSTETSPPPSPRRRLAQPARSRRAVSRVPTPPNAEFIGSSPAPPSQTHGISETAFAPKYFEKFFIVEKELGRGGRGVVLLVRHVLDGVTLGHFACKRVPIGDDHAWLEKVLVEVQLLQSLMNPNLVAYRHVWLEDYQLNTFGPSVPCAFILQQYCNGGDLHNYVCGSAQASTTTQELKDRIRRRSKGESELPPRSNEPRKLTFEEIYSFFLDITTGLQYLHANGFIHRDLKPSNCLLHRMGHETRVLVSDFGEVQYEYAARKSTGATGTISYCAPEVLTRIAPDGPFGNFTLKSDIFSLGMILHFLCFANLPYKCADVLHEEREDVEELRAEITTWEGFDDQRKHRPELPEKLYVFLKRLLSINPEDRPTANEVLTGIKTGGLDEIYELRRRNSGEPEELTPGRRIQRLDSPAPSSMPGRDPSQGILHSASVPQLKPSQLRRRQVSGEPLGVDTTVEDDVRQDSRSRSPSRSGKQVMWRPKLSSSVSSPYDETPQLHTPLLLPPAPENGMYRRYLRELTLRIRWNSPQIVRVLILVAKIFSLLQPCARKGINAQIVYPLLLLAILDFSFGDRRQYSAAVAAMLHVFGLGIALRTDALCGASRWEYE